MTFAVRDQGEGIVEERRDGIFDRFTHGEHSVGLGLGLFVAREIVEAHGGLIEVESTVGEGSTFRIFLPLTPPSAEAEKKVSEAVS